MLICVGFNIGSLGFLSNVFILFLNEVTATILIGLAYIFTKLEPLIKKYPEIPRLRDIHYRQKIWNICKNNRNTRIKHFDLLVMARCQSRTSIVILMQNTSPKNPLNFQGINHYIVNQSIFCVYSIIHYWHQAKFATGRPITIWGLRWNGRQKWLNVLYLFIWYPNEKLLYLCKPCSPKFRTRFLLNSVNMIYTNEEDFITITIDQLLQFESQFSAFCI